MLRACRSWKKKWKRFCSNLIESTYHTIGINSLVADGQCVSSPTSHFPFYELSTFHYLPHASCIPLPLGQRQSSQRCCVANNNTCTPLGVDKVWTYLIQINSATKMNDEIVGLLAALSAALSFGTYGVPMKGEAATRVDVDPLVFQSYKAFTLLLTSTILIYLNNILADTENAYIIDDYSSHYFSFQKWTFASDFTPWAFLSAILWVPGGTTRTSQLNKLFLLFIMYV